jgi:hypothetical protein
LTDSRTAPITVWHGPNRNLIFKVLENHSLPRLRRKANAQLDESPKEP